MKVLYITYISFGSATSGSSVRPQKMYQALLDSGHEIKLLEGSQGRGDASQRKAKVEEVREWLRSNRPNLCYIESPTYPIMLHADRKLIRDLHKMGVPIGYFYRDAYRRFPELFPRRKGLVNTMKETYLDLLQRLTDRVLQNVDIIYTPSEEFAAALPEFKDKRPLPPAGENCLQEERAFSKTCIYVGGITNHYGGDMLLDAFAELNRGEEEYQLIMVCRQAEWEKLVHPAKSAPWLEVHHTSGSGLQPLYAAAAAALVPKANNAYNNLAISVKLFEYMGHGLPVVSVSSTAMDHFMEQYGLGIRTEYDAHAFAEAIRELLSDQTLYDQYRRNAEQALKTENLWSHRVETIIRDLTTLSAKEKSG